jgi:mono/diheme cytochrome c family protein
MRAAVAALVVAALASACGPSAEESAPPADLIAAGADLYQANCAQCHGADLRGTAQGPSFLSQVYEPNHHSDASFQLAVDNGVQAHHWEFGPMPPVPGLEPDQVAAIVAFVRDRQQTEGFEPYP